MTETETDGPVLTMSYEISVERGIMEKKKMPASFVLGAVALLFMAVGYQTALFLHSAAVQKIAANRDRPDTVYVYCSPDETGIEDCESKRSGNSYSSGMDGRRVTRDGDGRGVRRMERKEASHSAEVRQMRERLPVKNVESFVFNPNTVSVEDLCRLGFSVKQARSIDNYRKKGGHFSRKEDFAKSYVVADSVYMRLEKYIDIPLVELNTADSTQLVSLPGIGGWYASKILEHRRVLRGFSCKEQLMDIYRFDEDKFNGLSDLVIVDKEYIMPYPLWTLPLDSIAVHPYISYAEAKSLVFFRENNPKEKWTMDNILKAGILSDEHARKLSRCVIANPE